MLAHTLILYLPFRSETVRSHALLFVEGVRDSECAALSRGGPLFDVCLCLALPSEVGLSAKEIFPFLIASLYEIAGVLNPVLHFE